MKLKIIDSETVQFRCAACEEFHTVKVGPNHLHGCNMDLNNPTIQPSVRIEDGEDVCNTWIVNGTITWENDSTHERKGLYEELPEIVE